jgi:hypothetical protein
MQVPVPQQRSSFCIAHSVGEDNSLKYGGQQGYPKFEGIDSIITVDILGASSCLALAITKANPAGSPSSR